VSAKWIEASPADSVTRVARRALERRFRAVQKYLPLAAKKPHKDIEHVHQLRVATRRAVAALDIFEPALPSKRARLMRKELRHLRRAVGQARDLDVLAQRLERLLAQGENGAITKVLQQVVKARKKAQQPALRVYRRARRRRLDRDMRRLTKRTRHPVRMPCEFGSFARQGLQRDVIEFLCAAAGDLSDIENLHKMRIAGKRLRYALEVYAGAFPDALRDDLYPVFAEVQEKLGDINDHATAVRLFDNWRRAFGGKKSAGRMQQLREDENQRLDASCLAFRQWWTPARAAALKNRFDQLLTSHKLRDIAENNAAEMNFPLTAAGMRPALASSALT
jgi:CHAD domain-containing protein